MRAYEYELIEANKQAAESTITPEEIKMLLEQRPATGLLKIWQEGLRLAKVHLLEEFGYDPRV